MQRQTDGSANADSSYAAPRRSAGGPWPRPRDNWRTELGTNEPRRTSRRRDAVPSQVGGNYAGLLSSSDLEKCGCAGPLPHRDWDLPFPGKVAHPAFITKSVWS